MIRAGESILTNIHDDQDREFIAHGVISAFARAFVSGHGIRVVRDSAAATGRDIREQAGYRAIAFWSTADTALLDDLRVDWLLVDPSRLTNHVRDVLAHSPRLRLVHREEDAARGAVREVYRVAHPKQGDAQQLTIPITVAAVEFPSQMGRAWFAEIPFAVTVGDPVFSGKVRIGTRVSAGPQIVNAGDRVASVVELAPSGLGRWSGKFPFVSPFEPGEYDVEITAGPAETPLPGPDGKPVRLKLRVVPLPVFRTGAGISR